MSEEIAEVILPDALEAAHAEALANDLPFSGAVPPQLAYQLYRDGEAVLVDVRTPEEYQFVGHVPDTINEPWATGTRLTRNPRFVRELEKKLADYGGKEAVVLLICRSGKRSTLAAEAAVKAGFQAVFNVLEGFEGELDGQGRRGRLGGWRYHGLPWVQE